MFDRPKIPKSKKTLLQWAESGAGGPPPQWFTGFRGAPQSGEPLDKSIKGNNKNISKTEIADTGKKKN